jgi:hypothetical protein
MRRILDLATPARLELARPRLEDIFIHLVSSAVDTAEERQKLSGSAQRQLRRGNRMRSILLVAKREFLATVATRAFIIGLLILPAMGALFALVLPRLVNISNMQAKGDILLIDSTSRILPELQKALDPERITARRKATAQQALTKTPQQLQQAASGSAKGEIENALGPIPNFRIVPRPADADIEQAKKWLYVQSKESPHLALVVMHRDAVVTRMAACAMDPLTFSSHPSLMTESTGKSSRDS